MINKLIAQVDLGTIEGVGEIGSGRPEEVIPQIISTAIGLLTVIAGIYFIFNLITASITIITAAGDKGNLEQARVKMTHSVIGLIVTVSGMFIVGMLTTVLGIPNFLNLEALIDQISVN